MQLHKHTMTSRQAREAGNVLYGSRKYADALEQYTQAFTTDSASTNDRVLALSNAAQCCLHLSTFGAALLHASQAIELDRTHLKSYQRVIAALLALGRPAIADEWLRRCPVRDSSLDELRRRVNIAMHEKKTGKFDVAQMVIEVESNKLGHQYHPEYMDPGLQVVAREGKGRGAVASRGFRVGEVLVACPALAAGETSVAVVSQLVSAMVDDEELEARVFRMDPGKQWRDLPRSNETDLHRLLAIVQSNSFSCACDGWDAAFSHRVRESTRFLQLRGVDLADVQAPRTFSPHKTVLWGASSVLNHSCIPNASWVSIGSFQLVLASKPITAGEEVCIAYADVVDEPLHKREAMLTQARDGQFVCQCPLCTTGRSMPLIAQAEQRASELYLSVTKSLHRHQHVFGGKEGERNRAALIETLQTSPEPSYCLSIMLYLETLALLAHEKPKAAARTIHAACHAAFVARGGITIDRLDDLLDVAAICVHCGRLGLARTALVTALEECIKPLARNPLFLRVLAIRRAFELFMTFHIAGEDVRVGKSLSSIVDDVLEAFRPGSSQE